MTHAKLLDLQRNAGAVFPEDLRENAEVTAVHFGDPAVEYDAATQQAALFDISNRTLIEIQGQDRHKFLHNFCTNDINQLEPGRVCEAFTLNVKGRVLGHIFILCGSESLWVESVSGANEFLMAHLDRYIITEDVQLNDRSGDFAKFLLAGPTASQCLQQSEIEQPVSLECQISSQSIVGRVDWFHVPTFFVAVPSTEASDLWQKLTDSTARPAGAHVFDALRMRSKFPIYGRDISDENLAQEVGRTDKAISFTKGCYLGQEPVARIDAMGHVNRELCVLQMNANIAPATGCAVIDGDQEVGVVTSSVESIGDQPPMAMAYLRTAHTAVDSRVSIAVDGEHLGANVASTGHE